MFLVKKSFIFSLIIFRYFKLSEFQIERVLSKNPKDERFGHRFHSTESLWFGKVNEVE